MIPTASIPLQQQTIDAIKNDGEEKLELFLEDLDRSKNELIELLREYQNEKDQRGQVYTFDPIDDVEIEADGKGGFWVDFPVNIYSGCRDVNGDIEEQKYISITIDFENNSAELTGEATNPVREPDEY